MSPKYGHLIHWHINDFVLNIIYVMGTIFFDWKLLFLIFKSAYENKYILSKFISFVNIFSVENVEQRVLTDSEIWYIFNNNRKFHSYINNLPFPILYERKHDQTSNLFNIFIIVISSNDILI